jgi:hypothetical protein
MTADGMNERRWRFLRSLRPVVRMLAENGENTERLFPCFGPLRCLVKEPVTVVD